MITPPHVTAIVVTHDRPELLRRCLTGLKVQSRQPNRVIVLDNASGHATRSAIDDFAFVTHVRLARNMGGFTLGAGVKDGGRLVVNSMVAPTGLPLSSSRTSSGFLPSRG